MHASIVKIEYFLPRGVLTTRQLSEEFPEWGVNSIAAKTGIEIRHVTRGDEYASDLAETAARKLFESGVCTPKDVDFLLLCTQSSDYALPTTACLLQTRLGIPVTVGAFDFNLGCSGFVYGLGLAEGLIASEQAHSIILITAETYSKYICTDDKSSRVIFGDGAAATFIKARVGPSASIGPFVYGTDGRGGKNLVVPDSGTRRSPVSGPTAEKRAEGRSQRGLFMDGKELFDFALAVVPACVTELLEKASMELNSIDLFVFHQANAYLLEEIRRLLSIPRNKFQITISHCANTVSSTIPIALKHAEMEGKIRAGSQIMLVGFGVGYSWGGTIVRWEPTPLVQEHSGPESTLR